MFHHGHSYIASRLYNSEDPLLLIGSILPDIAITKIITWDKGLHGEENNLKFKIFIEENYPDFINLAKGVNAHNILDDTSHLEYHRKPGYAFQNNKELVSLIGEAYKIDEVNAAGKAHNYIESAVDIMFLSDKPNWQEILKEGINNYNSKELAVVIGKYFKIDEMRFYHAIEDFFNLFTKYNFEKLDEWNSFWMDLEKLLSLKDIGYHKRSELLENAVSIVEKSYNDYLEYSYQKGLSRI